MRTRRISVKPPASGSLPTDGDATSLVDYDESVSTRKISPMQPEVVIDANAIAVSVSPDDVSYPVSTSATAVPPTIAGVMAIYKLPAFAITLRPIRIIPIATSAMLILCQ